MKKMIIIFFIITCYLASAQGLLAYYPFDGNTLDYSGNNFHATNYGGAILTSDKFGNQASAFEFDGVDDFISSNIPGSLNNLTISLWAYSTSNTLNSDRGVIILSNKFGMGWGYDEDFYYYLPVDKQPIMICNNYQNPDCFFKVRKNTWNHLVVNYSGNVIRFYCNGQLIFTNSFNNSLSSGALLIGRGNFPVVTFFKGKIDEVRIYNYDLSYEEVLNLFHQGGWSKKGDLVAYYTFDNELTDHSGNGNHGMGFNASFIQDRFDQENKSVFFNGLNSYISIPNSNSLSSPHLTNNISISLWFYLEQSYDIHNPFLTKSDQLIGDAAYALNYCYCSGNGGNLIDLYLGNNSNYIFHSFNQHQWYHLVVTYDGQLARFYKNGEKIGELLFVASIGQNDFSLEIGRNMPGLPEYYHGRVDDLRIFNGVLSQREIDMLYHENGWNDTSPSTIIITHGATFSVPPVPILESKWKHYVWQFAMADAVSSNRDIFLIRKGKIFKMTTDFETYKNITLNQYEQSIENIINQIGSNQFTIYPDKENVFIYDWTLESGINSNGYAEAAGDELAAVLIELGTNFPFILEELHFIGHSRGAVVNSEAIQRLIFWVSNNLLPSHIKIDSTIHMTTLDAHPAGHWAGLWGVLVPMDDDRVNSFNLGVSGWKNSTHSTAYIDNYYQENFHIIDNPLIGLNNFFGLKFNPPANNNLSNLIPQLDHSLVHTWYHGTVDTLRNRDRFDLGEIISRDSWYSDQLGRIQGFYYSETRGNDCSPISSINSLLKNVEEDFYYNLNFLVINGDFAKHSTGWHHNTNNNQIHFDVSDINFCGKLENDFPTLIHNKFYIPIQVQDIWFRIKTINLLPSTGNFKVKVYLENELINSFDFYGEISVFEWKKIPIPENFKGKSSTLKFELYSNSSNTRIVLIDDINFYPVRRIRSSVACPVDFHIYDNMGNHTGPINDSVYVEDIPGSRYFIYQDSLGDKMKTVFLNPLDENTNYSFIIESQDTNSYFKYTLEDYGDTISGTTVFIFDSVIIHPNTVANCFYDENTTIPILNLDLDGDGISDTSIVPIVISSAENFENINNKIPTHFQLSQNFPNPFNPLTNIKYYIPIPTNVTIKIFDIVGNEINTLVDEFKYAGEYSVCLSGETFPSGLYLLRMHAGGFVKTIKMVLIK